jgi:hypothetical protein
MQPNEFPYFVQLVQAPGPTFVAIAVGAFAAIIGWRQWRTGNYRLRLDMFDRRYSMYEATKLLIDKIRISGGVTPADFTEFRTSIRGAEFLFDGKTREFFKRLTDLSWRAYLARSRQTRTKEDGALQKLFDEEDECINFVEAEGPNLENVFAKYIDLSRIGL